MSEPDPQPEAEVVDFLASELEKLAKGAQGDIKTFAHGIATELLRASAAGDDDAIAECKAQARALAGVQRVRLDKAQWASLDFALGLAVRAVTTVLA